MNVSSGLPVNGLDGVTIPAGHPTNDTQKRKEAARDFEALLLGQLMHSMRSADGEGWLGTGTDQAGSTMGDFAEQGLSRLIAQQGGLGLASLIEQGLTPKSSVEPPPKAP